MTHRFFLTVLAGVCTFTALACDQSAAGPSGKSGKILYIVKNRDNPYFDAVSAGFNKAAAEANGEFEMVAPETADAASQVPLIRAAVDKGVKVLAISPNSADAVAPALQEAMKKGVTVITVDSDTVGHEDARNASVMAADPKAVGEGQLELMGSLMYYGGDFAILSSTPDAPNQNAWIDALKAALASNPAYKNMKLVDVAYGNDNADQSLAAAEGLVKKYPNLRGICSPTTIGVLAAAKYLDMSGKYPQIKLTGLGSPTQMRPFLQQGVVRKFALWDPYNLGYMAGYIGYQTANGSFKPAANATIQCGVMGKRTLDVHSTVVGDEPVVFTSENVSQYNF